MTQMTIAQTPAQAAWMNVAGLVQPGIMAPPLRVVDAIQKAISMSLPNCAAANLQSHLAELHRIANTSDKNVQMSLYRVINNDARALAILDGKGPHPVKALLFDDGAANALNKALTALGDSVGGKGVSLSPAAENGRSDDRYVILDLHDYQRAQVRDVSESMTAGRLRTLIPYRSTRGGIRFRYDTGKTRLHFTEGRLQNIFREILGKRYGNDINAMAYAVGMGMDELDGYIYGALPRTTAEVISIARKIGLGREDIVRAWEDDALGVIEYLYPVPSIYGPRVREFITLARLVTIHLGGMVSIKRAAVAAGFGKGGLYQGWNLLFIGRFPELSHKGCFESFGDFLMTVKDIPYRHAAFVAMEDARREEAMRFENVEEIPVGDASEVMAMGIENAFDAEGRLVPHVFHDPVVDAAAAGELRYHLRRVLATLLPREEKMLRMYFALEYPEYALGELKDVFSVTPERVRQIGAEALRKLRHPTRSERLKPHFDEP